MESLKTSIVSARFLQDLSLYKAVIDIIENAKREVVIISPYIKLNTRLKNALNSKKRDVDFSLAVVFGKNEGDVGKSISKEDFDYFTEFPDVRIVYHDKLHAKYIANERYQILSSMNLHDYSISENYEAGLLLDHSSPFDTFSDKVYNDSYKYFTELIETGTVIFDKEPKTDKAFLGWKIIEGEFDIRTDRREEFFKNNSLSRQNHALGYCIRTGVKIPFDIQRPYSKLAYKEWIATGKENTPEIYCHFSGEESNGQNSFKYPVLKKNWSKSTRIK